MIILNALESVGGEANLRLKNSNIPCVLAVEHEKKGC